jgi:hypothetical protein
MDAVDADQNIAFGIGALAAPASELGDDLTPGLIEIGKTMVGKDPLRAQPGFRRLEKNTQQASAIDRNLRPFIAGRQATGFLPDQLPELVVIGLAVGQHAGLFDHILEPKPCQLAHRVGQKVDSHPQFPNFGHRLEYANRNAALAQGHGGNKAADTAADNQGIHRTQLR